MGGGRINKPRSAACRLETRKVTRERAKERKKPLSRSQETLDDTTLEKLRQCRSNPRANVRLSGKKKRLLLKEAKRLAAEKTKMEVVGEGGGGGGGSSDRSGTNENTTSTTNHSVTETMETAPSQ